MKRSVLPPVPSRELGAPFLLSSALCSRSSRASVPSGQQPDPAERGPEPLAEPPRRVAPAPSNGS